MKRNCISALGRELSGVVDDYWGWDIIYLIDGQNNECGTRARERMDWLGTFLGSD